MKATNAIVGLVFAASLVLCSSRVVAQNAGATCDVPSTDQEPVPSVRTFSRVSDCLGSKNDRHSLVIAVEEATKTELKPGQVGGLQAAMDALAKTVEARPPNDRFAEIWQRINVDVAATRVRAEDLRKITDEKLWNAATIAVVDTKWKNIKQGITIGGRRIDFEKEMPKCQAGAPCEGYASWGAAVRVVKLLATLEVYSEEAQSQRFAESASARLDRWEAYRDKGRPLYWWEVYVNGVLMDRTNWVGENLCAKDKEGVAQGFCAVPNRQLILLHPEAAVRFSRTATKSDDLKAALLVEVVGAYWWNWKEGSAEMLGRKGISLAASYTSTEREDNWGYGPMFHLGSYSLAVTKANGGKWSLVLNVPLGEKLYGRKQEIVDELSKSGKSGFLDLLMK